MRSRDQLWNAKSVHFASHLSSRRGLRMSFGCNSPNGIHQMHGRVSLSTAFPASPSPHLFLSASPFPFCLHHLYFLTSLLSHSVDTALPFSLHLHHLYLLLPCRLIYSLLLLSAPSCILLLTLPIFLRLHHLYLFSIYESRYQISRWSKENFLWLYKRCCSQPVEEIRRHHPPILRCTAPLWSRTCRNNRRKKIKTQN